MTSDNKMDYPRASDSMVFGGILVYIAGMFLLIAFASPYWVESYDETFSEFKHMGLWEYCFERFRFPYHQFDKIFSGCHYIYSFEFHIIREWLLPGWLLTVQTFVTLAFILSFSSQLLVALIVTRYPLKFVLKYEWLLSGLVFICNAVGAFFLFLAVVIFWTQSSRRDWLMYPNFNHISWSYYFCALSFFLHAFAAIILYKDAKKSWDTREEKRHLVMEMYPQEHNGFI
uniref:Putative conserved plasma membrane protein n=1 Tax=Panstrongylus megistus TaxID=65343 RepID=A0A069DR14_9HEMI